MLEQPNETVMRYRQFVDAVKNMGFDVGVDSEWITVTKSHRFHTDTVLGKVSRKEQYVAWVSVSLEIDEKQRRKLWLLLSQFAATHPNDRVSNAILKAEVNGSKVYIREYFRSTESYTLTDKYREADVFHISDAGKISTEIMNDTGISFELEMM